MNKNEQLLHEEFDALLVTIDAIAYCLVKNGSLDQTEFLTRMDMMITKAEAIDRKMTAHVLTYLRNRVSDMDQREDFPKVPPVLLQ